MNIDPHETFMEYIQENNYCVPPMNSNDHPSTINLNSEPGSSPYLKLVAAHNKYHMKGGDILVCYGLNRSSSSLGNFPGHAAIATSSKFILEMPGTQHRSATNNARHISKKAFFQQHTHGSDYVAVYRIKNHPVYSDQASTYAYHYMYEKYNPTYSILNGLNPYIKSPSYCSKYVYYAYWKGATKNSVEIFGNRKLLWPYNLPNYFTSSFHPSYIHKITRY